MIADRFPWLTAILLLPLITAFAIPFLPDKDGKRVRWYALGVGIADFILMCYVFWKHDDPSSATFQLAEKYTWIPELGLSWAVSVVRLGHQWRDVADDFPRFDCISVILPSRCNI